MQVATWRRRCGSHQNQHDCYLTILRRFFKVTKFHSKGPHQIICLIKFCFFFQTKRSSQRDDGSGYVRKFVWNLYCICLNGRKSIFLTLKLRMACYSLIEEVFKNPLNSGMNSERNFGLNDGQNWKTCSRSGDGGCREDFASLWSVLIFPFLIQLLQVFSNLFSSHFSS